MKRIAINGLGRIGRLVLRHFMDQNPDDIQVVAVNDLVPLDNLAYLLKYDSVHGPASFPVEAGDGVIGMGGRSVQVFAEKDPARLPWKDLRVDTVIESTGFFSTRALAAKHIEAGAKRVLISAPCRDADFTLVVGVNDHEFDPEYHRIISTASCTTNSLVPPLKVLLDRFGINRAMVTTVHAYTGTQGLVDRAAKKAIRGRAAALSLIPTSTGSDEATVMVLPELKDRIRALAIRAPIPVGAITDIVADLNQVVVAEQVNSALKSAAEGRMEGILGYTKDALVSADIVNDTRSGIVHGLSTCVVQGSMVKIQVWYDNEFGYSRRLLDAVVRLPL